MSSRIIDEACIAVPILGSALNEDEIVQHYPGIGVWRKRSSIA